MPKLKILDENTVDAFADDVRKNHPEVKKMYRIGGLARRDISDKEGECSVCKRTLYFVGHDPHFEHFRQTLNVRVIDVCIICIVTDPKISKYFSKEELARLRGLLPRSRAG